MSYPGIEYGGTDDPRSCRGDRPANQAELSRMIITDHAFEEDQTWRGLLNLTYRLRKNQNRKQYKYFVVNECLAGDYGDGPHDRFPQGWHGYCSIVLAENVEDLEQLQACASLLLGNGFTGGFNELFENAAILVDALIDGDPEEFAPVSNQT